MHLLFITATRIGDAVLSTGLLGRLIEEHPGIRVTVAVGRLSAPLFAAVPGLERIVVIDTQSWNRHWLRLWRRTAFSRWDLRSEEHTSELQSLMRISYAVFCLRKKKKNIKHIQLTSHKQHVSLRTAA